MFYIWARKENSMRISHIVFAFIGLCFFSNTNASTMAGDSVTETKNVSVFTVIKVQGNFNVVITQSGTCSLKITADKHLMPSITVSNKGVTLNVTMPADAKGTATLYIGVKDINQITITTNGNVSNTGTIKSSDLAVNIDGNAVVNFNIDAKVLNYSSSSGKESTVKGKSKMCTFKDGGEGNIDASGLETDNMNVDDSSDGDLKVYGHPELHAKITGTGNFTYYGKPRIKTFKVEGAANSSQVVEGSK
jgi:hypothetical protein